MAKGRTHVGKVSATLDADATPFQRGLQRAKANLESFAFRANWAGSMLTYGLTVPLIAVAGAAARASAQFETSMKKVEKTIGDVSQGQLDQLAAGFRRMSEQMPASAADLGEMAAIAAQLGVPIQNLQKFARVVADMGVATDLAGEQAAFALARLSAIMGTSFDDVDKLASVIVDLGNNFAVTESEITDMGVRIAAAGRVIGISEADVLAFAAALRQVGVNSEAGGTAISRVMLEIDDAVSRGGQKLQDMAKIAGMPAQRFAEAWREDAAQATAQFIKGLDSVSASGENVFATLESVEFNQVRVRNALLATASAGSLVSNALDRAGTAWEEGNALTKEAERFYTSLANRFKVLKNQAMNVAAELGDALRPAFDSVMRSVKEFLTTVRALVHWFGNLDRTTQSTTLKWIAFIAAIGPALKILSGIAVILRGIIPLVQSLGGAVARLAPALAGLGVLRKVSRGGLLQDSKGRFMTRAASRAAGMGMVMGSLTTAARGLAVALGPTVLLGALAVLGINFIKRKTEAARLRYEVDNLRESVKGLSIEALRGEIRELEGSRGDGLLEPMRLRRIAFIERELADIEERKNAAVAAGLSLKSTPTMLEARLREELSLLVAQRDRLAELRQELMRLSSGSGAAADGLERLNGLLSQGEAGAAAFEAAAQAFGDQMLESFRSGTMEVDQMQSTLATFGGVLRRAIEGGALTADAAQGIFSGVVAELGRMDQAGELAEGAFGRLAGTIKTVLQILDVRSGLGTDAIIDLNAELDRTEAITRRAGTTAADFAAAFDQAASDVTKALEGENLGQVILLLERLGAVAQEGFRRGLIPAEELRDRIAALRAEVISHAVAVGMTEQQMTKLLTLFDAIATAAGSEATAIDKARLSLERFDSIMRMFGKNTEAAMGLTSEMVSQITSLLDTGGADAAAGLDLAGQAVGKLRRHFQAGRLTVDDYRTALENLRLALSFAALQGNITAEEFSRINGQIDVALRGLPEAASGFMDAMRDIGESAARLLIRGLMDGFKDGADLLKRVLEMVLETAIIAVIRHALKLASPSRVAMGWGQNITAGLALGMERSLGTVRNAAGSMADAVMGVNDRLAVAGYRLGITAGAALPSMSPAMSVSFPAMDLGKLPKPLTPREAALNREWVNLVVETINAAKYGGFKG